MSCDAYDALTILSRRICDEHQDPECLADGLFVSQVRRPVLSTSAAKPANPQPVLDRRAGREREREKEEGSSSKNKGMQCRFCGKVFTHAPAHLQHERAHLQQQETKNP